MSTPPVAALRIRPYRPTDRESVREICFRTAFMGGPIDFLYSDAESWADIFTRYYTDREPESAWVVVDGQDRVVGYLLGCADTRRAPSELRVILDQQLTRFLWLRRGTARFWWRAALDSLTDGFPARPRADLRAFPGHFHIDLMPEARGTGIAAKLIETWHAALRARGIPGAHAEVMAHNARMLAFVRKLGYAPSGAPFLVPAWRNPDGSRVYGQLIVCALNPAIGLDGSKHVDTPA